MEFDTKTYDEAAVKHALRTKHIAVGGYDDTIRVVVPNENDNGYLMIKYNKTKRPKKCTDMSLRGIPKDKDGKPLVSSEPATVDELKEVCKILGCGIPN